MGSKKKKNTIFYIITVATILFCLIEYGLRINSSKIDYSHEVELSQLDNFKVLNEIPYLDIDKYIRDYDTNLNPVYWDKVINYLFGIPIFLSVDLNYIATTEEKIYLSQIEDFCYNNVNIGLKKVNKNYAKEVEVSKGQKLYAVGILEGVSKWNSKQEKRQANLIVEHIGVLEPTQVKELNLNEYTLEVIDITEELHQLGSLEKYSINDSKNYKHLNSLIGERVRIRGIVEKKEISFNKNYKNIIKYGDFDMSVYFDLPSKHLEAGDFYEIDGILTSEKDIMAYEIKTYPFEQVQNLLEEEQLKFYKMIRDGIPIDFPKQMLKDVEYVELNVSDLSHYDKKLNQLYESKLPVCYTFDVTESITFSDKSNTSVDDEKLGLNFEIKKLTSSINFYEGDTVRLYGSLLKPNKLKVTTIEKLSKESESKDSSIDKTDKEPIEEAVENTIENETMGEAVEQPAADKEAEDTTTTNPLTEISFKDETYLSLNREDLNEVLIGLEKGTKVVFNKTMDKDILVKSNNYTLLKDVDSNLRVVLDKLPQDFKFIEGVSYNFYGKTKEVGYLNVEYIEEVQ